MGVWNWLTGSLAHEVQLGAPMPPPPSPRVIAEVAERERSVDGLNSWQREQVRQIVSEEIAALLPAVVAATRPAPAPRPGSGATLNPLPLRGSEREAQRPFLA